MPEYKLTKSVLKKSWPHFRNTLVHVIVIQKSQSFWWCSGIGFMFYWKVASWLWFLCYYGLNSRKAQYLQTAPPTQLCIRTCMHILFGLLLHWNHIILYLHSSFLLNSKACAFIIKLILQESLEPKSYFLLS